MRHWLTVPTDCKTGAPNPHADLYFCDGCAFGSVLPVPAPEQIAKFYRIERYFTHGCSHFEEGGRETWLDRVRSHIAWRLDKGRPLDSEHVHALLERRPSTICDLGCGGGLLAAELTKLGHRVTGVEVDPGAGASRPDTFAVFAGTAEALPGEVRARRFDAVVLSHVLEHCRDPAQALRNALGILEPSGKLILEVPNNASAAREQLGCAWEMFDVPRHLHFFTRKSLTRAVERTGMRVTATFFGHYARQFQPRWVETERKLWRNLMGAQPTPDPLPVQNSRLRAWRLLFRTVAACEDRKYDSVGVVAVPR